MGKRKRWMDDEDFGGWDIEEEFERMQRYMERVMHEMLHGEHGALAREPFVYGFSMRVGPDGKARIQRFGNTRPMMGDAYMDESGRRETMGEREPLTDVISTGGSIAVTIEIPGVRKEDIDLTVGETKLTISVDAESRRYYKDIELPESVDPNSAKATYNNGVLDITLKKRGKRERDGRKVMIE
ncbi:MAG: archaeal heat shock protein Hsp20 [Candidatus Thermoplasmatota archaeon]